MLVGIVFNRMPFFRGKDNYDQLRKIAEVMGSEDLDRYIDKYKLRLDRETVQLLGRYERHAWKEFETDATRKFINDDLYDYLDKTLVYDHAVPLPGLCDVESTHGQGGDGAQILRSCTGYRGERAGRTSSAAE